jgi:sodium/hydrogen antiporter
LGTAGLQWLWKDVAWAISGGLTAGYLCGFLAAHAVARFVRSRQDLGKSGSLLLLALIAVSYGLAMALHAYAFLAVFAAAVAVKRTVPPATSQAEISHSLLDFNEQLERVAEFGIVMALGVMLSTSGGTWTGVALAALIFAAARPLAICLSINRRDLPSGQYRFVAWFGIRGVGSVYYLFFAVNQPIDRALTTELIPIVLTVVACSIVAHGISATPLMRRYDGSARARDVPS